MTLKKLTFAFLIAIIVVVGTGFTAQPAQAVACQYYHTVYYGQTLSSIGAYYGINWQVLASVNGVVSPYKLYAGTVLCIPYGGYVNYGYTYPTTYTSPTIITQWSFSVIEVAKDTSVTVRISNAPSNVFFNVSMGNKKSDGSIDWEALSDLDTDQGGIFRKTFNIPVSLQGKTDLVIQLKQVKKNGKVFSDQAFFSNTDTAYQSSTAGGYAYNYPYYNSYYLYSVPTFSIIQVRRNSTVTIRTNNFPAGLTFDVLMGPMGTQGIGGYYVGTLYSGSGGTLEATFNIPPALYNSYQIAIRTQNYPSGYYSYNWFYNNNAY